MKRLCITILLAVAMLLSTASPASAYIPSEGVDYQHTDTGLTTAWNDQLGSSAGVIAVLDTVPLGATGAPDVQFHSASADLKYDDGNVRDWDGQTPESNTHGARMSSLAASDDNDGGAVGSCPNCQVMYIQVDQTSGWGEGIRHAVDNGADTVVISFDMRHSSWQVSFDYAWLHGVPVFYAAGNDNAVIAEGNDDGSCSSSPCYIQGVTESDESVVIVASSGNYDTTKIGERGTGSNYGTAFVDVSAPGMSLEYTNDSGGVGATAGTSFAAPFAAGMATLLSVEESRLTGQQLVHSLQSTADQTSPVYTTYGLVQADDMLAAEDSAYNDSCNGSTQGYFDDTSVFHTNCAAWYGIMQGDIYGDFNPTDDVTRGQMATVLVNLLQNRGFALPTSSYDYFDDDDGSVHESAINDIAYLGISGGCSGYRTFCPNADVQRDEVATFLSRTHQDSDGTVIESSTNYFVDDSGNVHERAINGVYLRDIMEPCSGSSYFCPTASADRQEIADASVEWITYTNWG